MLLSTDYHSGKSLLNMDDLKSGLVGPYDAGARGVVIWGSSSERALPEFLDVRNLTQSNTCKQSLCCHEHLSPIEKTVAVTHVQIL